MRIEVCANALTDLLWCPAIPPAQKHWLGHVFRHRMGHPAALHLPIASRRWIANVPRQPGSRLDVGSSRVHVARVPWPGSDAFPRVRRCVLSPDTRDHVPIGRRSFPFVPGRGPSGPLDFDPSEKTDGGDASDRVGCRDVEGSTAVDRGSTCSFGALSTIVWTTVHGMW